MVSESLSSVSSFEKDIRKTETNLPVSLTGAHGFVSTKSFVSLQLTKWSLEKLSETCSSFKYNQTNMLSMMTLSVEHFHSTTHTKQVLMSQLQYAREFMTSVKESLKRLHPWSVHYFTSRKGSWYPATESSIDFNELSGVLPKKHIAVQIPKNEEEKLRVLADSYTRAVRQRSVRQETTMAKCGTLPTYLYTDKVDEIAQATDPYNYKHPRKSKDAADIQMNSIAPNLQTNSIAADLQTNSLAVDVQTNSLAANVQTNSLATDVQTNSIATDEQTIIAEEEQPDSFDPDSGDEQTAESSTLGGLDEATFFMVGRSTRFGRKIKVNSKFIS